MPTGAIDKAAEDIEGELQKLGKAEVPSGIIGQMVMNHLRKLDRVAYIRYASVYRDFADVETFKEEVDSLLQPGKGGRDAHCPTASDAGGGQSRSSARAPEDVKKPLYREVL